MIEKVLATPKGAKKDFSSEMPLKYNPIYVEAAT
jgi:adenylosuccinate lyase